MKLIKRNYSSKPSEAVTKYTVTATLQMNFVP